MFRALLLVLVFAFLPALHAEDWLNLRLAEVALDAPFAFMPKRDARSAMPADMAAQFVSFDIYESETKAAFPMHVNVVRIQYREADKVNLDATAQSAFRAVAEAQGDKDAPFDQNTTTLDGLEARRLHYNGLGRGKMVSVETVAARQGPVLWSVMVTYNKAVPRDSVTRVLDSVHVINSQPAAAIAAPGGGKAEGRWFITSLDEVTLEAPFQFSARKDARDQVPASTRDQFTGYDIWQGTGRPALPLEVTLSRLSYKDNATVNIEALAASQIKTLAAKTGDDENTITATPGKRDGLDTIRVHYDGLPRGKKLGTDILLTRDGQRVWVLQAGWNDGVPPGMADRVMDSVHIITPDPDFSLAAAPPPAEKRTLGQDLAQTYGWCQGLRDTLEAITHSVPELADEATRANLEWENVFKAGIEGVTTRLKELAATEWPAMLDQFKAESARILDKRFTREAALEFIAQVRSYARGRIASPMRETLLAAIPAYARLPVQEFRAGYTGVYSTVGQSKAAGLRFALRHPLSWTPLDLDAPDILRQWTSDGGHGGDFMRLCISKLPEGTPPEAAEAAFTSPGAQTLLPPDSKFLRFREGRLNGRPLGITHFTAATPAGAPLRCVMFYFLSGGSLVSLQGLCSGDTEAAVEERFSRVEPLFQAVVDSVTALE